MCVRPWNGLPAAHAYYYIRAWQSVLITHSNALACTAWPTLLLLMRLCIDPASHYQHRSSITWCAPWLGCNTDIHATAETAASQENTTTCSSSSAEKDRQSLLRSRETCQVVFLWHKGADWRLLSEIGCLRWDSSLKQQRGSFVRSFNKTWEHRKSTKQTVNRCGSQRCYL